MNDKRKEAIYGVAGVLSLVGGGLAAVLIPRLDVSFVLAGFAGYVLCGRRVMILSRADDRVFSRRRRASAPSASSSAAAAGLQAGTIGSYFMTRASLTESRAPRRLRPEPPRGGPFVDSPFRKGT